MSDFVHLHVHTQYSLLDGAADIQSLLAKAGEYQMPALAITDHGVMYGCLKFYRQALKTGIKPILGCEVYVAPRGLRDKTPKVDENPFHLTLLAENEAGYRNLMKLVSIANIEGFYYKPRIDLETLRCYATGLIGLSGCLSGVVSRYVLNNKLEEAEKQLKVYQGILGRENFFIEIQFQQLEGQRNLNRTLAGLALACNAPLVATNDVHYLNREDSRVHDVLLCIQTGKTVDDPNRMKFATSEFYLKPGAEMQEIFHDYPEALANTVQIAERCQVRLELGKFHMPEYQISSRTDSSNSPVRSEPPTPEEPNAFLEKICRETVAAQGLPWDETREERLKYELGVIQAMGFSGYFLIVRDFVNFAKENQIMVGPGRGSAAGSLVAYLLGITGLDPIELGLLFERFLNPERISMPDIDIDFCYERRNEVITYVRKRFGTDRVAQIITFGTMAARAAVRDVGRVLGLPYGDVDRVAKLIPNEPGITIADAKARTSLLTGLIADNPHIAQLVDIAEKVEGFPRHASTHAAGVVITGEPLTDYLPLSISNEGEVITQFTMEDIEDLGLLKMDFLGLRTLTVLRDTMALIEQHRGKKINLSQIPPDDPVSFAGLQKGSTLGLFQLESSGIRRLLIHLKPDCISDLTALNALYRPGPLGSGMVEDFIKGRHGQKTVTYLHPLLEPILKETYGVILYQEQVMKIVSAIGGFTLGEADLVRRAMGKKKPEVLAAMREQFLNGATRNGVNQEIAAAIFDLIEHFAGYGYNKSHSAAYALVIYQTAYFKFNYPEEYMAALLTSVMGNPDKIGLYIEECRALGLKILKPDVNRSVAAFSPEQEGIRFGLLGIKNVGGGAIEKIIAGRQNGPYRSLFDFCSRVSHQLVNRRVIESLIRAGAFDFTNAGRSRMLAGLNLILEKTYQRSGHSDQLSLLDSFREAVEPDLPDIADYSSRELLQQEKEYLGVYLSGHPLDEWRGKFQTNGLIPIADLEEEPDGKEVLIGGVVTSWRTINTKSGSMMAGCKLEDLTGTVEVVVFPKLYNEIKDGYLPERVTVIKGRLEHQDEGVKVLAAQLRWLSNSQNNR
jgi:DNA polymerase-3 subunit alpha